MLNRDDPLEHGPMVDVRQMRELDRFGGQHGGVKHYVVILDAGHVQGGVIRSDLGSDVALSPADPPEIFHGNAATNFEVASRKMIRHFGITRRSLTRFQPDVKWSSS